MAAQCRFVSSSITDGDVRVSRVAADSIRDNRKHRCIERLLAYDARDTDLCGTKST